MPLGCADLLGIDTIEARMVVQQPRNPSYRWLSVVHRALDHSHRGLEIARWGLNVFHRALKAFC